MNPYDVQELIQDLELEFDIDDSAIYCDNCQEELNLSRENIRIMMNALDRMPMNKLKQVYDLLDPYYTGEENG